MEIPLASSGKEEEPRRTVLDQSQVVGDSFDEDVLAEIERRLDREEGPLPGGAGEKVELDKADLPILAPPPVAETPPEVEVDLAGEAPAEVEIPAQPAAEPPKSKKKLFILAGAGGALVLVLVLGSYFLLRKPAKPPAPPVQVAEQAAPAPQEPAPEVSHEVTYTLEPFLVPLLKTGRSGRLLRLSVNLEVGDTVVTEALDRRKIAVRDVIYRSLRDRPADELQGARAKNLLQTQIKTEINHLLGAEGVTQVIFSEFVITG